MNPKPSIHIHTASPAHGAGRGSECPFGPATTQNKGNTLTFCPYPFDNHLEVLIRKITDSPLFEPMSTTRSPSPITLVPNVKPTNDSLQAARALKATIEAQPTLQPGRKSKLPVEDDPENQMIKELRVKYHMEWTSIANFLNEERRKRGEPPNMTQPAVYSRFVRNAPRIAAANGEVGFDPKDYMHLRHPYHYPDTALGQGGGSIPLNAGSSKFRKRRRGSESEAGVEPGFSKGLLGNTPKKSKTTEGCAELETPDRTKQIVEAVVTIQRNFWVFVADELERTTGKLYDPKDIAARFASV